jgi:hypothetical protein
MTKPSKELLNYSLEALENEIKVRKKILEEEEKKKQCTNFSQEVQDILSAVEVFNRGITKKINITLFKRMLSCCSDIVEDIKEHNRTNDDDVNYLFEDTMKFVYGKDFFERFYNKYC